MALQPVSGVTPLHANNVSFGARNRNNDNISEGSPVRVPSGLKAVPIAVLIAMSPLNNVEAYAASGEISAADPVEQVDRSSQSSRQPEVIKSVDLKDKQGRMLYTLKQLSTDGDNSDFEAVELIRFDPLMGGKITQRAIIKHVYMGKYSGTEQSHTAVGGYNLDQKNLNSYEKIIPSKFSRSFVSESANPLEYASEPYAKELLDPVLKKWIVSDKNNGALKLYNNIREFSFNVKKGK